jgi:alpha-mannosidase
MQAALRSERDVGDTYTFQPASTPRPEPAAWGPARSVWTGPLIAAVAREFRIAHRVRGTVYARLDAGSRLVRYVVEGMNVAGNHRLRIVFPFPVRARSQGCRADMAFGPCERGVQDLREVDYPREWPVRTAPMHRWVNVPDVVTVFARGLYEYELLPDGVIAVTLFRAVGDLSHGDLRARPGHAAWPASTPDAQELGRFRAELAVAAGPMAGAADTSVDDEIERLAEEFHAPLAGLMLSYAGDIASAVTGPRLDGDGLRFEALKLADLGNALVLRCVNVSDRSTRGKWTFPWSVRSAHRARLDETPLAALRVTADGCEVTFTAAPREIVTVLIERRS